MSRKKREETVAEVFCPPRIRIGVVSKFMPDVLCGFVYDTDVSAPFYPQVITAISQARKDPEANLFRFDKADPIHGAVIRNEFNANT